MSNVHLVYRWLVGFEDSHATGAMPDAHRMLTLDMQSERSHIERQI